MRKPPTTYLPGTRYSDRISSTSVYHAYFVHAGHAPRVLAPIVNEGEEDGAYSDWKGIPLGGCVAPCIPQTV